MRVAAVALIGLFGLLAALLGAAGPARADAPPQSDESTAERWSADPRLWLALIEWRQRLRLELASSRELCTAGTLTEISWQISGGKPPYKLQVEGTPVNADADNVRINCGALTEAEAADEDAALAAKRITATVTDSRGVRREAAIDVARARALPPLQSAEEYGDTVSAYRGAMGFEWRAPAASYSCRSPNCYAIRWRAVGAEAWNYAPLTHHLGERGLTFGLVRGLADGVAYEAAGAAMRDPIELQTPEALRWTSPLSGTTLTNPTGLTATATHDTVTVRWNRQPSGRSWSVYLRGPSGALRQDVVRWDTASWGDPATGVHEVVFRHLSANTRYKVLVDWSPMEGYEPTRAEAAVETLPLPPGREPLLRGPQNLRATTTHDSITVMWDQPFKEATDRYWVYLFRADYSYRASRHGTAWHPNTQFTFSGLKPGMTYRVVVVHMAIVRASAEVSATTRAMPLALELHSSRELCTAGTLTEVSWQISGGTPPYELQVDGTPVNADADNIRINCGALSEAEADDEDATLAAKRVTATVTDSRGVRREAAIEVARARALPAAFDLGYGSHLQTVTISWSEVDPSLSSAGVVRYRSADSSGPWSYSVVVDRQRYRRAHTFETPTGEHMASVAAVRHALEAETPEALNWSEELRLARTVAPQNLIATATHDTVTVAWDKQPYTTQMPYVSVSSPAFNGLHSSRVFEEEGEYGRHEVVFKHVPPDTEYVVTISMSDQGTPTSTSTTVRTTAAPADWAPPPRGPQNLRATATHDSITVTWEAPHDGARLVWLAELIDEQTGQVINHRWFTDDMTWTVRGSRSGGILKPNRQYRILVEHRTFKLPTAEITVTTSAPPTAAQSTAGASDDDQEVTGRLPFFPIQP